MSWLCQVESRTLGLCSTKGHRKTKMYKFIIQRPHRKHAKALRATHEVKTGAGRVCSRTWGHDLLRSMCTVLWGSQVKARLVNLNQKAGFCTAHSWTHKGRPRGSRKDCLTQGPLE